MKTKLAFAVISSILLLVSCGNNFIPEIHTEDSKATLVNESSDGFYVVNVNDVVQRGMDQDDWGVINKSNGVNIYQDGKLILSAANKNGEAAIGGDIVLGDFAEIINNYIVDYAQFQKINAQSYATFVAASGCGPRYFFGIPVGYDYCPLQKWSTPVIYYRFGSNVSQADREIFKAAITAWKTSFVNVSINPNNKVVDWQENPSHPDVVTVKYNTTISGGQAYIGMKRGGSGYLDVNPADWQIDLLLHEMMHTAGAFHEHQRCDRDQFITMQPGYPYNDLNYTTLCTFGGPLVNTSYYGAFDYSSITGYNYAFTGTPFTGDGTAPSQGSSALLFGGGDGTRTRLSEGDVKMLLKMYFSDRL